MQSSTGSQQTTKYVTKRNGQQQPVDLERIKRRITKMSRGLNLQFINSEIITAKVYDGIYSGVKTSDLDNLAAETCAYMSVVHPDYSRLAARISVSRLHKETTEDFLQVCKVLRNYKDKQGREASLLADDVYEFIEKNIDKIKAKIDYERDFNYDYFGFKTLERSYLLKVDDKIAERPQQLLMRVSCGIQKTDIDAALETYDYMSQLWFTHATPTLFYAGTPKPQMSSCFLLTIKEDSIEGIYETLKQCAVISKQAGGIGLSVHGVRATDSYIRGTNGYSSGLVPMLRVFNDTARYVDQGGGRRKGAFAIYLEPWHSDVYEFLQLRKNHGKEEQRARDLFYALWIPDLFMKRVEANQDWTLMCPNECPGLEDCWGEEFEKLYAKYEAEGKGRKTVKAQWLWTQIVESQIETGTPYMLYKDSCNRKSNQQNLGTIKSSNLCTEIVEYTSPDEVAVCNLASIALSKFVNREKMEMDYEKLHMVTKRVTKNLNNIIDYNFYPVEEAKRSNMRHRPVGIGIQGLADVFQMLKIPFEDPKAVRLNELIFETIYHAAMETSMEMAKTQGPYETFKGSPLSQGKFQFDLWGVKPASDRYDWDKLRKDVMEHGARNSLLIAPMPTASTSQILGNNESFEAYTTNVYTRRVIAGEFICINPHLVQDLIQEGLWTSNIKNQLMAANGSVQNLAVPQHIKELYKTVWEISQRAVIDQACARGPYICQSQSLNLYMPEPNFSKLTSMHFYGWKKGLKTGQYYLRSRPSRDAIKFTVNVEALLAASDSGNKEEMMKQLNKGEEERIKNKLYIPDKEKLAVSPKQLGQEKPKLQLEEADDDDQEMEVVFECENCSA